jgi:DNA-binding beta-propeller fold protein YncE
MTARPLALIVVPIVVVAAALQAAPPLPKPALLVVNKSAATLAIVDPASGQVVATVPTGDGPHEVVANGTLAFVGNYGAATPGNSLSIIDLASLKEVKRVDLGPMHRPHGLALVAGTLFFTSETNRLVASYDTVSGHFDWAMGTGQTGTHMVWVHQSGSPVVTTNIGSDSVTVMERGANALAWTVTHIPVGRGPEGFDVSPNGTAVWAAHSRDGGVSVIDLASKKVIQTFDLHTKRSNRLKFTLDGRFALITDLDAGDLLVVDAGTRALVTRVPIGKGASGILLTPDGARAYVASTAENYLAIVDLKTWVVTGKIATSGSPDGMAWVQ